MKSLATAFKEVYGEALKEYGFKKVKGKYPYYARMVGDEIVQVITCATEWCGIKTKKAFTILGGVATVYRRKIILDVSPKDNDWLIGNHNVYWFLHGFDLERKNKVGIKHDYEYDKDDEESLLEALNYSWKVTEENLLASLNKVKDISDCIDFYRWCPLSNLGVSLNVILDEKNTCYSNEGVLNVIYYGLENLDGYIQRKKENFERLNSQYRYWMDVEKRGITEEYFKNDRDAREKVMLKQIEEYRSIVEDSDIMEKIKDEIEKRKLHNEEILKAYGVIDYEKNSEEY